MILVEKPLGNERDPSWAQLLEDAVIDTLDLDQWQAQKSRMRLRTDAGVEVAIALDRNSHLRDGDVLAWDEPNLTAIVARVTLKEVMILKLDGLMGLPPEELARACVELGHALGNQHWPAVVKGTSVYVPLTVDQKVMESVMRTHAFEGITPEFAPGAEIIPHLAPHEAGRLFGGAESTPHSHAPTTTDEP